MRTPIVSSCLLVALLAACSFDLSKHPSACKVTADCKQDGYYCYQALCIEGPGSNRAGTGGGAGNGGSAGTHAAGSGGSGASGVGGGSGAPALDASSNDLDAALPDIDAGLDSGVDAGPVSGIPTLPTCAAWLPAHDATCPAVCNGGCTHDVCTIACDSLSCLNKTLTCPNGYACQLACTDPNVCTNLTLQCADGPCEALCSGMNSCTNLHVHCGSDACRASCSPGTSGLIDYMPGTSCGVTKPGCP